MTIAQAIKRLEAIRQKHGDDTVIFFDCPECGRSFEPNIAAEKVQTVLRIDEAEKDSTTA